MKTKATTKDLVDKVPLEKNRADMAESYAYGLAYNLKGIDWAKVNGAIMARWSSAGLIFVKKLAWTSCRDAFNAEE